MIFLTLDDLQFLMNNFTQIEIDKLLFIRWLYVNNRITV